MLVTGGGPIGALSVAALARRGVDDIVVSEPHPNAPRRSCEQLGARVVEPDELVTPPSPHDLVDEPFDVALECSGHAGGDGSRASAQLKRAGTLVLVGAGHRARRGSTRTASCSTSS